MTGRARGRRTVVAGAALALALAAAGCGGSDSGADVTAAEISKAEFIEKADEACQRGKAQTTKDFAAYVKAHEDGKQATESDYADLVTEVLTPNANREIEEIRALGAPSGDEDEIGAMLEAREKAIETAEAEPKVVISEGERIFGPAGKLAKRYGLKVCGN